MQKEVLIKFMRIEKKMVWVVRIFGLMLLKIGLKIFHFSYGLHLMMLTEDGVKMIFQEHTILKP